MHKTYLRDFKMENEISDDLEDDETETKKKKNTCLIICIIFILIMALPSTLVLLATL